MQCGSVVCLADIINCNIFYSSQMTCIIR